MIEIKAPVSGWHKTSKEQAINFARAVVKGAWCGTTKALDYLNKNLLRGIKLTKEDIENGRDI